MKHILPFIVLLSTFLCKAVGMDSLIITERIVRTQRPMSFAGSVGQAWSNTAFKQLPGVESCCTEFVGRTGSSWTAALSYDLFNIRDGIFLTATGGISVATSNMNTVTKEIVDYKGDAYEASIDHVLSVAYWNTLLELGIRYEPFDWLTLSTGAGATIPIHLNTELRESLLTPSELVFETGSISRNVRSGTSPSSVASLFIPIHVQGPDVNIGRHFRVQPHLSVRNWLTSINTSTDWGLLTLEAGLRITLMGERTVLDTAFVPLAKPDNVTDSVMAVPDSLKQRILATAGVRDSVTGVIINAVDFTFNVKRRRLAVLPAVFFDSASSVVPPRFMQKREIRERIDNVNDLEVNHSIIHLLATTLRSNPKAKTLLTGSHADDVQPGARNDLAQARAQSVAKILMQDYGIDQSRIVIATRSFPERPSSVFTEFGREENRRVDIELQGCLYNLPVQVDTVPLLGPRVIDVVLSVARPETVTDAQLLILVDGVERDSFEIDPAILQQPEVEVQLALPAVTRRQIVGAKSVAVVINMRDSLDGDLSQLIPAFDVSARLDELQPYDEYGIVLFDYNSTAVSESESRVIAELRSRVEGAKYIKITGTSDESGDEAANLRLAEGRARSVARSLGVAGRKYELDKMIARDYSSDLPEGRQLGRQVKVILKAGEK